MNRTVRVSLAAALLALAASTASAQPRGFPEQTKLGTLEVLVFPQARLDDKPVVLAPGVRIHDTTNLIVTPQSVQGKVNVRYRLDPLGQVTQAWMLTAQELDQARKDARREGSTAK